MSIETITEADRMSVFKDDNGTVYTVKQQEMAREPDELVNNYSLFAYSELGVSGYTAYEPFNTILDYGVAHEEFPSTEELPELFSGELCKCFKCDGWVDHDFRIEGDFVYCVDNRLGTAEEWSKYPEMWEEGLIWEVTDTSNAVTLTDVYADSAREALGLYLEQGGLASLSMRMKAVL